MNRFKKSGLEQTARIEYQVRLKATCYLMAYLYTGLEVAKVII